MDNMKIDAIETIERALQEVKEISSLEIKRQFDELLSSTEKNIEQKLERSHPLSKIFFYSEEDVKRLKDSNGNHLSDESYYLIALSYTLKVTKSVINIEKIISDMSIEKKFYSSVYELKTAQKYVESGYVVEAIEESKNQGERSPDFKASKNGDLIFIECKSLEKKYITVEQAKKLIEKELPIIAKKNNKQFLLLLLPKKPLTYKDVKKIVTTINNCFKDKILSFSDAEYSIELFFIASYSTPTKEERIKINFESDINKHIEITIPAGITKMTMAFLFDADDITIPERIINNHKKAKKQLPDKSRSVLHIEIPTRSKENFYSCIDKNYKKLEKIIQNNDNIDIIEFSVQPQRPYIINNNLFFSDESRIVINRKRKSPPIGLLREKIQSNSVNNLIIYENEGTVEFTFDIDFSTLSNIGCNLYKASNMSYTHHINIDLITTDTLRIEFESPVAGVIINYLDISSTPTSHENKLCVSYSDKLLCAMNGEILDNIIFHYP